MLTQGLHRGRVQGDRAFSHAFTQDLQHSGLHTTFQGSVGLHMRPPRLRDFRPSQPSVLDQPKQGAQPALGGSIRQIRERVTHHLQVSLREGSEHIHRHLVALLPVHRQGCVRTDVP